MRAFAPLLLLFACAVPEPSNREVSPTALEVQAVIDYAEAWKATLGAELGEPPPVRWFVGECLRYDVEVEGECPHGVYWDWWDGDEIHVLRRETMPETSLAHELLHWALNATEGRPDDDHNRAEWLLVDELARVIPGHLD